MKNNHNSIYNDWLEWCDIMFDMAQMEKTELYTQEKFEKDLFVISLNIRQSDKLKDNQKMELLMRLWDIPVPLYEPIE